MMLLTVKQVAERLQCSEKHVRRLVDAHQIGHVLLSHGQRRFVRIPEERLAEWLRRQEVVPVG